MPTDGHKVSCVSYTYQKECKVACDVGYYHNGGDLLRICQADKNWNGTMATCTGVPPPIIQHAGQFQFLFGCPNAPVSVLRTHLSALPPQLLIVVTPVHRRMVPRPIVLFSHIHMNASLNATMNSPTLLGTSSALALPLGRGLALWQPAPVCPLRQCNNHLQPKLCLLMSFYPMVASSIHISAHTHMEQLAALHGTTSHGT